MCFFFAGLPGIVAAVIFTLVYGVAFLVPACLTLPAVLWLWKKLRSA